MSNQNVNDTVVEKSMSESDESDRAGGQIMREEPSLDDDTLSWTIEWVLKEALKKML